MKIEKIDIAVVGGGSAGLAAAVMAARAGAKVALIERQGMLGGMATNALVHSICGLYLLRENEQTPIQYANEGFPKEFAEALLSLSGARGPIRMGRLDILLHQPTAFAYLADNFAALSNVEVFLHTEVLETQCDSNHHLSSLTLHSRGSRMVLQASAVIDTTGDAEIAALSGARFDRSPLDKLQRPAYIFSLNGVDSSSLSENGRLRLAASISYGVSQKKLPESALGVAFRSGVSPAQAWGTIDLEGKEFDPLDCKSLSSIEKEGRAIACQLISFLTREVEGFAHASVDAFPARAGIRESRRIRGLYELTQDDILSGGRFGDEIALASWPIELRESARGPKFQFPLENRPCGIPLRCLKAETFPNLFMAGRCLSASHRAQAAIRVIGTTLATGEAAGKAAIDFIQQGGVF